MDLKTQNTTKIIKKWNKFEKIDLLLQEIELIKLGKKTTK